MKIYLDIDGTMIHEDLSDMYGKPAAGLEEFLVALRGHDTYWLTTHCTTGDPRHARELMKSLLSKEYHADIERIKPTAWKTMKTEAIDFDSDFIWFDDNIFDSEWKALEKCGPNQSVVEMNLRKDPKQLLEITRDLLEIE